MAKYPVEKYNIVVHQHPTYHTTEIIAFSTYAGKVVKGHAICQVGDNYNEEAGKKLAIARCAAKIACKRQTRAAKLLAKANKELQNAQKYVINMTNYFDDACQEVHETKAELASILASM